MFSPTEKETGGYNSRPSTAFAASGAGRSSSSPRLRLSLLQRPQSQSSTTESSRSPRLSRVGSLPSNFASSSAPLSNFAPVRSLKTNSEPAARAAKLGASKRAAKRRLFQDKWSGEFAHVSCIVTRARTFDNSNSPKAAAKLILDQPFSLPVGDSSRVPSKASA
jgi:hypothetical protein